MKQSQIEKIDQNITGFALSDLAGGGGSKLARYAPPPPFYGLKSLANIRLPLMTATLSEVYPSLAARSMSVNWIDDGIEYITVGALRLRMDI